MNIQTSKTILKVFGIIGMFFGGLTTIGALFILLGGGAASIGGGDEGLAFGALLIVLGILSLGAGLITVAQGFCSYKASQDTSKIMPAWLFSIIGIVSNVVSVISSIKKDSGVFTAVVSLVISIVIFTAANTIKNNG
ncbi:MAG: hypothetical protein IKR73_01910 [Oscillospiraceae bacterium]|nr:hypothetical protein [Oscillospiraceae bacterium]